MKKSILSLACALAAVPGIAQTPITDTVVTGLGYANNIWYSLENDNQGSAPANNWDIAIAATASMSNPLTTSIFINPKIGVVYEVPGSTIADFATLDTTGLSGWTPLYNSDTTWAEGALNRGGGDYGWGKYTGSPDHNVAGDRVFLIKYAADTSYVKFHVTLLTLPNKYALTYDKLDNSDLQEDTVNIADYSTKNFFYYSFKNKAEVDREPAKDKWDLLFNQYTASSEPYGTTNAYNQYVTGVLQNVGVEAIQADGVDQDTYEDFGAHTFSKYMNIIGFNWKDLNYATFEWELEDSTVYFVKPASGDIWKLVMTGFGGSTDGSYIFNKTKLVSAGIKDANNNSIASVALYPNPANGQNVQVIYSLTSAVSSARLLLTDMAGRVISVANLNTNAGMQQHPVSTNGLQPGVYIVHVVTDKGNMQQKLVVQ